MTLKMRKFPYVDMLLSSEQKVFFQRDGLHLPFLVGITDVEDLTSFDGSESAGGGNGNRERGCHTPRTPFFFFKLLIFIRILSPNIQFID